MLVFDTNVLVDAVDEDSPFHDVCCDLVSRALRDESQSFVTWSICYEFRRVTTHANAPISPWSLPSAVAYLDALLSSPSGKDPYAPLRGTGYMGDETMNPCWQRTQGRLCRTTVPYSSSIAL